MSLICSNAPERKRISAPTEAKPYYFFDKMKFRAAERPTDKLLSFVSENSSSVDVRRGHPIAGRNLPSSITIVAPNDAALLSISRQPWLVNEVEIARNTIPPDDHAASAMHDLYDRHFVHPWHGKHEMTWFINEKTGKRITYSGQRINKKTGQLRNGLHFAWYSDRHCKLTGEWPCFHLEARFVGAEAVRERAKIPSPAYLVNYDFEAFWRKHDRLETIDTAYLGRFHLNRLEGKRRQKPRIEQWGPITCNVDLRMGGLIKRVECRHPRQQLFSVQWLIDGYGRGPFLVPIRHSIC
jgi:hypothetical protein